MPSTTISPVVHPVDDDARNALAEAVYKPAFPPAWAVPVATGTLHDALVSARTARGLRHAAEPWRDRFDPQIAAETPPLRYYDRSVARVLDAGSMLGRAHARLMSEGPRWFVSVGPGRIRFGSIDPARLNRRHEREDCRHAHRLAEHYGWLRRVELRKAAEQLVRAGLVLDPSQVPEVGPDPLDPGRKGREIMEWTPKSRAAMIERLSTLDYEPLVAQGVPAMATLTLPGDWLPYARTGADFKVLVRNFVKRYERAWKRRMIGLWKMEFQRRGAPHLHVLMVPPAGTVDGLAWRDWFARAWASVVVGSPKSGKTAAEKQDDYRSMVAVHRHPTAACDYAEGLRASDPRRVAVYFLKHSLLRDKEYQHVVPAEWQGRGDGPGRFWGYWGLERADLAVPLTYDEAVRMARVLRKWQAAKGGTHRVSVPRQTVDSVTGEVVTRYRSVRRRLRMQQRTAGFTILNDGPAAALLLAESCRI